MRSRLWREWGLDAIFREAWTAGVVLAGMSAGANCWFEQCTTDSVPGELRGRWSVEGYAEGEHRLGGFSVLAREVPHGAGRTMGLRVDDGRACVAYVPDHGPTGLGPGDDGLGVLHPAALALATGADLLLMVSHGADAIMLIREMVKQRWEPMGVMTPGSPGTYEAQLYKALGKYSDFVIANLPWINSKTAMSKELLDRFAKVHGDEIIELNVGFSLEAVLIAVDAHKRANSGDPKEIAEALRKTDIAEHVMIGGPIRFDEKGQNTGIESAALQNLNRKPTVVLPQEAAEASPVLPFPGWSDERRG